MNEELAFILAVGFVAFLVAVALSLLVDPDDGN